MLRWCIGTHRCVTQWDSLYLYHKELEFLSFLSFCLCMLGKKPQLLIVHKTVFSMKRLCKCSNVKPSHLIQTSIKDTYVSRRLLLSVAATKPKTAWKVEGVRAAVQTVFLRHQKCLIFTSTSHSQAVIVSFSQVFLLFDLYAACYYKILNYHLLPQAVSEVYRCKLSNQTVYVQLVSPYSLLLQTSQSKVHKREKQ